MKSRKQGISVRQSVTYCYQKLVHLACVVFSFINLLDCKQFCVMPGEPGKSMQ
jgi:hypothetical protein